MSVTIKAEGMEAFKRKGQEKKGVESMLGNSRMGILYSRVFSRKNPLARCVASSSCSLIAFSDVMLM